VLRNLIRNHQRSLNGGMSRCIANCATAVNLRQRHRHRHRTRCYRHLRAFAKLIWRINSLLRRCWPGPLPCAPTGRPARRYGQRGQPGRPGPPLGALPLTPAAVQWRRRATTGAVKRSRCLRRFRQRRKRPHGFASSRRVVPRMTTGAKARGTMTRTEEPRLQRGRVHVTGMTYGSWPRPPVVRWFTRSVAPGEEVEVPYGAPRSVCEVDAIAHGTERRRPPSVSATVWRLSGKYLTYSAQRVG
jgi:hypothetical protein